MNGSTPWERGESPADLKRPYNSVPPYEWTSAEAMLRIYGAAWLHEQHRQGLLEWRGPPCEVGGFLGCPGSEVRFKPAAPARQNCGFCGRETYADLKPMCGDCAGKEDPETARLRAELAKAKADLRDKFAGYAMRGLVSNRSYYDLMQSADMRNQISLAAYRLADAMLAARDATPPDPKPEGA